MKRARSVAALLSVAVLASLTGFGCGSRQESVNGAATGDEKAPQLRGLVNTDGSSTVYPITEAVAEEFQKQHPGVRVTVGVSGTGGGFKKFGRGETDLSNASRPIKDEEAAAVRESGADFVELPVAYDALSVVVNPRNDWALDITVEELRRVWEPAAQGKVTRWSQVRPGWPDRPIKLYGPGSDSGTFDYFTDVIVGEAGASRGDYTASEDDNVLVQGVASDPNALGYFGMAYFLENRDKLRALPIDDGKSDNGAGAIGPTAENVVAGHYQPLSRPIFIYARSTAIDKPHVKAFVEFYLDHARDLAAEAGYVPLPPEVYALARQRFESRTYGSFARNAAPGARLEELLKPAE